MFLNSLNKEERKESLVLLKKFDEVTKQLREQAKKKNVDLSKIKITLKK